MGVTYITGQAVIITQIGTTRENDKMTRKHYFRKPTQREQLKFEQILLEQMQIQRWAVVLFVDALQSDVLITLN